MPSATGTAARAKSVRLVSSDTSAAAPSDGHAAEPALARLVVSNGLEELPAPEVGPEHRGDEELRVGELPEQEVGDALLAGGADEEVGVREAGGEEATAEGVLVDRGGVEPPRGDVGGEEARRAHQLGAAAVRDEQVQRESSVRRGRADDALHRGGGARGEPLELAEDADAHPLL